MRILLLLIIFLSGSLSASSSLGEVPVAYKGRFRPMEAYSQLWLYHLSNKSAIPGMNNPNEALFQMHIIGHASLDNTPLFWVNFSRLKVLLQLEVKRNRFSYKDLHDAIFQNKSNQVDLLGRLIPYYYQKAFNDPANRSRSTKVEISALSPGLWVTKKEDKLVILANPKSSTWNYLAPEMIFSNQTDPSSRQLSEELLGLIGKLREYESGAQLNFLPSKKAGGEWLPLSSLKQETNPTKYSNELFLKLKSLYFELDKAILAGNFSEAEKITEDLSGNLINGYATIAGEVYQETSEKKLSYPTEAQLKAEFIYYRYPLTSITIVLYGLVLILFLLTKKYTLAALIPFAMHTFILGMRCFILGRPPVSNMFETVIYVPWVAVLTGLAFYLFFKNRIIMISSILIAFFFLVFLQLTRLDSGMENVQAVLDSQYWLMIHVLMIVGSYSLFILGGILGHIYLGWGLYYRRETPNMQNLAQCMIQTIYVGTALLVTGTILGGVWAAESWGRFWDWDPKESWAFISSCIYVILIHLYTFRHIGNLGLAVGSVVGLSAIGFTWYGVNYILGTGLHSYGFGSGGEQLFYLFVLLEAGFLLLCLLMQKKAVKD
jgi:ABC-type transport system involved in cytochrome c biogenesis permease subunit